MKTLKVPIPISNIVKVAVEQASKTSWPVLIRDGTLRDCENICRRLIRELEGDGKNVSFMDVPYIDEPPNNGNLKKTDGLMYVILDAYGFLGKEEVFDNKVYVINVRECRSRSWVRSY